MIIGIAGTIGAGKGTVVEYLTKKGFAHYSSSALLREILAERGLPATRDHFSPLATEMRSADPAGVPRRNHDKFLKENPENAIFEALHSEGEADFIRSIGGHILGIDADMHARYARTTGRGEEKDKISFEDFERHVRIEDEGSGEDAKRNNNIRAVLNNADAVIHNNGTLEELYAQVDDALQKFAQK
jgi:dephospho-CoA kinase